MAPIGKHNSASVADEVAAAEANFRLAQERLNAARQRAAQERAQSQNLSQATPLQGAAPMAQPVETQVAQQALQPAQTSQPAQAAQPASAQPYAPHPFSHSAAQSFEPVKDHIAAGLFAIFFGWLGIHKFYLGFNGPGFIYLAVSIVGSIFTFGAALMLTILVSIVEGVIYLFKSQDAFDALYVHTQKPRMWF